MSDWQDKSDFEINKAVATSWLPCDYDFDEKNKTVDLVGYVTYLGVHGIPDERLEKYGEFNPCSNPSDAWPVILDNEISIVDPVSCGLDKKWMASKFYPELNKKDIDWDDKNPLRAAMIVYLEMNNA